MGLHLEVYIGACDFGDVFLPCLVPPQTKVSRGCCRVLSPSDSRLAVATCLRGCRDCPELSPDLGALVLFGAGWDIGWDIRSDTAGDSEMWAFFGGGIISEPAQKCVRPRARRDAWETRSRRPIELPRRNDHVAHVSLINRKQIQQMDTKLNAFAPHSRCPQSLE